MTKGPGLLGRRDLLRLAGGALAGLPIADAFAAEGKGLVVGQPEGARAGMEILAAGGNAVDAAVGAALVAGVVGVHMCGPAGYGGCAVIGFPDGRVTSIDFNSVAPAAARPDMYSPERLKAQANTFGWLAAGVPGTLAGLDFALKRYGTMPFRRILEPALKFARDGYVVSGSLAGAVRSHRERLEKDPGSARLLLPGGERPAAGSTLRNPDLAAVFEALAAADSADPFYKGAVARRIAEAFRKNGGLVTEEDLANYRPLEAPPLRLEWRGYAIHTAPLAAGGLTVLQALAAIQALGWSEGGPRETHARIEVLRAAWHDRLRLLGDPAQVQVPIDRLLSEAYAKETAARVSSAVQEGKPLPGPTDARQDDGTIHLSAVDAKGMMVALTLTQGNAFGAQVTVEGLGLMLGHGMMRFEPRPGHPNAPAPGKRPLHNMCPTLILKGGRPVFAMGATGGRKIPNTLFDVLVNLVGAGRSLEASVKAPRAVTEGGMELTMEAAWPGADVDYLKKVGYAVKAGTGAKFNAVQLEAGSDPRSAAR